VAETVDPGPKIYNRKYVSVHKPSRCEPSPTPTPSNNTVTQKRQKHFQFHSNNHQPINVER
jgi:hypothetical protein